MDNNIIAKELANIPAGFLPEDLFNQIARLGVLVFLEVVALREKNGQIEVMLIERPSTDPFWAGLLHNPGTVLRPNDTSHTFSSVVKRVFNDEYGVEPATNGPFFAGFWFDKLRRGKGFGIVSWVELTDSPNGNYYPVNALPKNVIEGQPVYIKKCAQDFANYKRGNFNPTPIEQLIIQ